MESNMHERIDFTLRLLYDLKSLNEQLTEIFAQIEKSSDTFYESFLDDNRINIESDLNRYKINIEKTKQLNMEITSKINAWFEFTKDDNQIKKLSFPIKFFIYQRKLKKDIKRINKQIYDITIENRFVKEKLITWESEIEVKAVQQLKLGTDYRSYEKLIQNKNKLITDFKYILPTLPVICPVKIDLDNIDAFIQKHLKTPTA